MAFWIDSFLKADFSERLLNEVMNGFREDEESQVVQSQKESYPHAFQLITIMTKERVQKILAQLSRGQQIGR